MGAVHGGWHGQNQSPFEGGGEGDATTTTSSTNRQKLSSDQKYTLLTVPVASTCFKNLGGGALAWKIRVKLEP